MLRSEAKTNENGVKQKKKMKKKKKKEREREREREGRRDSVSRECCHREQTITRSVAFGIPPGEAYAVELLEAIRRQLPWCVVSVRAPM
jgi:hypothetical protein